MIPIVVLYYSRGGHTRRMANQIARGIEQVDACRALVRTVPELGSSALNNQAAQSSEAAAIGQTPAPLISKDELRDAAGLILGSPTRFGNMAAPLKAFLDSTSDLWLAGTMNDKPAAVFTSSSSYHGGQESTLLTMMLPLLHHGMLMTGIPYREPALSRTETGGTPYGASHISGNDGSNAISADEKELCTALGRRVARIASALQAGTEPG